MTSSPSPLAELLADAVAEPPTIAVTASETYRRGRRRRGIIRVGTVSTVAVAVAVAAVGVAELRQEPDMMTPAAPRAVLDPLPETPTRCADLAEAVKMVAEATLPAEIEWTGTRLAGASSCAGGGLFWVTFVYRGEDHRLGFEGGPQAAGGQPCDADRSVTDCENDGPYQIGHYESEDDYGVLLGRPGLFFFLGLDTGREPPLTTDQLATVAMEIARIVYVD